MNERLASIQLTVEAEPEAFADEIEAHLLDSLRQNVPASDYAPFGILARDGQGVIVGGLIGGTSYGWLVIKILWVSEDLRSQGLGARIMRLAEGAAVERGCHGAWLDTSSRRAKSFYEKLGYETFGILENQAGERPQGHARFFLRKQFSG
ncbi:GNAT family N-acetyltransferase [Microvirga sp. CF3016]|uniref:GNAT family N-acetyltransferase n=1 Tax=Microvirga sp. CF3016 TaxID=3110181 RepID=UPI002E775795|nr:GNAT family N-acetyltransferase [Microvirga sp. CF3016]MEE1613163.1 GNAT family N-acetyltransferase [Microvirga sp. CF3016]